MSKTDCRVWEMFQARCMLCRWQGIITVSRPEAAGDARDHRAGEEHQRSLRERK